MPEFAVPSFWFDLTIIQFRGVYGGGISCTPIEPNSIEDVVL